MSRSASRTVFSALFFLLTATFCAPGMAQTTTLWQWTIEGQPGVYDSKPAAVHAMQAIDAQHEFLTEAERISISDSEEQWKYSAKRRDPDVGAWRYTRDGSQQQYDTEEEAFEAMRATYAASSSCEAWGNPVGDWTNPGIQLGVVFAESRTYQMYTRTYSAWSDPHCIGETGPMGAGLQRRRSVACPSPFQADGFTAPHCFMTLTAKIIGKPLECCSSSVKTTMVGDPVDAASGNRTQSEVDWSGPELSFVRSYQSLPGDMSAHLGIGWTHNFNRIFVKAGSSWGLVRPDGRVEALMWKNGALVSTSEGGAVVRQSGSQWVASLKEGTLETYDANGRLLQISSKGRTTMLSYTGSLLTGVTGPFGHSLQLQYENDRLTRVIDPAGNAIEYSYDSADNLVEVTYPDTTTRTYHYEDTAFPNHLTGVTDQAGVRFSTFGYDSMGRATSTELAASSGNYTFSYSATSSTVTDPLGTTSTYQFTNDGLSRRVASYAIGSLIRAGAVPSAASDLKRRVSSLVDERGITTTFVYDLTHLTSKTEAAGTPRARTTTYQYRSTDDDLPTLISEPNRSTAYTYNTAGNPLTRTVTDTATSATRTWTWTYDTYGRLATDDGPRTDISDVSTYAYYTCTTGYQCGQIQTITNALSQVTAYNTYNAHGQPLTITDPNGVVTTLAYDARQRLTSRQVGSETTTFTYWPTGLLKKVTLPDASYLQYNYDDAHRLIKIQDGEGNHLDYTLDGMGNRTAENAYDPGDVLSRTRTQVFNSLNQLWKQIGAADTSAVTTTFSYDGNGNQTSINAPLSRNTANQYDELNRLKQITDPGTGVTQFAYDANDNLSSVTDPRSLVTSYQYNGFGDLKQQTSPDTGTTSSTYDSGGNLATRTDARSKTGTYTYDALNRVTSIAYPDLTTTFTYDSGTNGVGRLTGASDANHSLNFTYDAQGRVTGRTQTVGSVTQSVSYGYTNGNLTSIITPSGQTIGYGYTDGRITSVTLNGSTTILDQVLYAPFGPVSGWRWGNGTFAARVYDTDGKPTTIDSAGAVDYGYDDAFRITSIADLADSSKSWTYGYDVLDRLNSAAKPGETIGYTYDANGNRQSQTGTLTAAYTVAATSNRINSIAGTPTRTYGYDAAGNTSGDGSNTYTYTDAGKLSSVTRSGATTAYVYNALGQRVKKSNSSLTRYFMYDQSGGLQGEYDGSGALIQETVWLNDTPVATLRPNGSGVSIYYVHTDHLNTPRRLSRPIDNTIVWRWDSDPFGVAAASDDPDGDSIAVAYNLRFPGQYFDAESGASYNYRRNYDPYTSRYLESDPIGLRGGINTYAYVNGNPISLIDPQGLMGAGGIPNRPGTIPAGGLRYGGGGDPGITTYYGAEAHAIVGGGLTSVTCTDECGTKQTFRYAKICLGYAFGGGVSGGAVGGMKGKSCRSDSYSGYFAEGGLSAGPISGAIDIGATETGWKVPGIGIGLPNGLSGVNEVGGGLGIGAEVKASLCYYIPLQ